ncbi:MAG: alpha/beta hydrolase [Actinomycetota bacterium]
MSIPHAEPFELQGGEIAILMIHGFTGSPASIRPWAEGLHAKGFTVKVPRLPGHGTTWDEMNTTSWQDWYLEVEGAFLELKKRHRRVFVAGFSMGGALSIRLANKYSREIEGLILLNPSVGDRRLFMNFVPILKYLIPSIKGRGTDVAAPNPPRHSYGRTPLKALHSLQKLWRLTQIDLPQISSPLMIGYSVNDHVVDPKNSEFVIENVASVDIREVVFERSFHNVALDHDLELLVAESHSFITDVLSGELSRGDESELIDQEFESIVEGLSLDESAPTSYIDELENMEAAEKYEGDNRSLPTLTSIQRGALLGVTLGPAYIAITKITAFDLFGLGIWPGMIALFAGVFTFFWQMKPDADDGDGVAL